MAIGREPRSCSGGSARSLLYLLFATITMTLVSAGSAQYGYYDHYTNPFANPSASPYTSLFPNPYANPYGGYGVQYYPSYPGGYGMPGTGYPGGVDPVQQQMVALQAQIDAQLIQLLAPFIKYYRENTGDWQTPDAVAAQYGTNLWCTNFPTECERAMNTITPEGAEWMAASAAAHQELMAHNAQYQDARQAAWFAQQQANYEAHVRWILGVIHGEEGP